MSWFGHYLEDHRSFIVQYQRRRYRNKFHTDCAIIKSLSRSGDLYFGRKQSRKDAMSWDEF